MAAVAAALAAAVVACTGRSVRPVIASSSVVKTSSKATCESCHEAIAAEWRASFHRTAYVDGTFQASLALEDATEHAFCTHCHAPAAARAGVDVGVDCVACHTAAHVAGPVAATGTASCATCHEFAFPDRAELVQQTASEHHASGYADVPCTTCHMPSREGHRDHRFLAGHAPGTIAAAVRADAKRARASDALSVTIRVDAGHAFPTGDMFRRARLLVFAEGARGEIVADAERTFGRTWAGTEGVNAGRRTQTSDTRIRGEWHEDVRLDSPTGRIVRVRWSLLYERVLAVQGSHVTTVSSDVIAEGEIAW